MIRVERRCASTTARWRSVVRRAGLVWLGMLAIGCGKGGGSGTASARATSTVVAPRVEKPVVIEIDPDAREPLELTRIAESVRATALLNLVESRRPERTAALLALAHAEDAELVVGRLAELAQDPKRDDRVTLLTVIRDVAYRRPPSSERLDPGSVARCVTVLRALARDESEDEPLRALAATAVNAFVRNELAAPDPGDPTGFR